MWRKKIRAIIAVSILAIALPSCTTIRNELCHWCDPDIEIYESGKAFNFQDSYKIKRGMHLRDVLKIMGKPYTILKSQIDEQWVWSYATGGKTSSFSVQFQDGKVLNISRSTNN
tara:strand:- start:1132 stop:1473 length:342 start_codon:yes stop_codon:yes gene_type:complete